jgi:Family of unknown function (DUF5519)
VVPAGAWGEFTLGQRCGGEACHAHPSDGSLHLTLHPEDEAVVLKSGWGELHPLSRGGWLTRFVPQRFMMVYAPRDEEELELVLEIVRAAVWWVGGVDFDGLDDDEFGLEQEGMEEFEKDRSIVACLGGVSGPTQKVMLN